MIAAVDALARGLIASVRIAVANTGLARWESPEIRLTLVALLALHLVVAVALARLSVAKVVLGASRIAVAC